MYVIVRTPDVSFALMAHSRKDAEHIARGIYIPGAKISIGKDYPADTIARVPRVRKFKLEER
jgi:hypothetical protein